MVDGTLITSFLQTRWLMSVSAAALGRHREKLWRALQPSISATPALAHLHGRALDAYPIAEPKDLRADYGRWNSLGLSHTQLIEAATANENPSERVSPNPVLPRISVGFSTGTSGNRGVFVASARERSDYIGQSLARLLPWKTLMKGARIALILRASSELYSEVGHASRFAFTHIPLSLPIEEMSARLQAWQPTILIAPAHILANLANAVAQGALKPLLLEHCFTGSEPMGERERIWIESLFGLPPLPIYQATEGFLGAPCRFGRLHLNEHAISIRPEPIAGTRAWRPIVTDLRRHSQPIVNVRLDDALEDCDQGSCPCGYAGRIIKPVAGRVQDIWHWGGRRFLPREVNEFISAYLPNGTDWQAIGSDTGVELRVDGQYRACLASSDAAVRLSHVFGQLITIADSAPDTAKPKRRQIIWRGSPLG
jgi:putative adenylate-forming enzyme